MTNSMRELKNDISRKVEIARACDDVTDELIRVASWYLIEDPNSDAEDGRREPQDTDDERFNYLRYQACCVAIEAVRKMMDK